MHRRYTSRRNPDDEFRRLERQALTGDEKSALQLYYLRLRHGLLPTLPQLESSDRKLIEARHYAVDNLRFDIASQHQQLSQLQKRLMQVERTLALSIIQELRLSQTEDPKWQESFWNTRPTQEERDLVDLNETRRMRADAAFEVFDFDGRVVEGTDGWSSSTASDGLTRNVYLNNIDDVDGDSERVVFVVDFRTGTDIIEEAYVSGW